jgi:hypothetical protein
MSEGFGVDICIGMGRAQESIARKQEGYLATATATWLEGLERSLAQMKEYQVILVATPSHTKT